MGTFSVDGDCDITENFFIAQKGYKRKWFLLEALPIAVLILLVFSLFFVFLFDIESNLYVVKVLFLVGMIIAEFFWWRYIYKVMKMGEKCADNEFS